MRKKKWTAFMLAAVMAVSNMQTSVFAFDMSMASEETAGTELLAEEPQAESLEEMPEGESQTESAEMI